MVRILITACILIVTGCDPVKKADKIFINGNIWTSAGKAIKCFNPNGEIIGQLLVPELVSNLEFGGKEGNILYVTATTSLYSMELNQIGVKYTK